MSMIREWIPCKDRQPSEKMRALVTTKEGVAMEGDEYNVQIMCWDGQCWRDYEYWDKMDGIVIAWMPLPEKYQPEED